MQRNITQRKKLDNKCINYHALRIVYACSICERGVRNNARTYDYA